MTGMVERVARAIECVDQGRCNGGGWADGKTCQTCVDVARAAIYAMREPTVEMVVKGQDEAADHLTSQYNIPTLEIGGASEIWQAMIDEALK